MTINDKINSLLRMFANLNDDEQRTMFLIINNKPEGAKITKQIKK